MKICFVLNVNGLYEEKIEVKRLNWLNKMHRLKWGKTTKIGLLH